MKQRVFTVGLSDIGISQLYLCREKLEAVDQWFDAARIDDYEPLPVFDFGNGRLTLTDGHSRAFTMLCNDLRTIRVVLDFDKMITSEMGQKLYIRDIEWCERKGLHTVMDLSDRIISEKRYVVLWLERCKRLRNLFSSDITSARNIAERFPDMYLYGMSFNGAVLYFERNNMYYRFENGIMENDEFFNNAETGDM